MFYSGNAGVNVEQLSPIVFGWTFVLVLSKAVLVLVIDFQHASEKENTLPYREHLRQMFYFGNAVNI